MHFCIDIVDMIALPVEMTAIHAKEGCSSLNIVIISERAQVVNTKIFATNRISSLVKSLNHLKD